LGEPARGRDLARGRARDRPPVARHAPDREPAPAPGTRLCPGAHERPDRRCRGRCRPAHAGCRFRRARPDGPGAAHRDPREIRRRARRARQPRRRDQRGARDHRGRHRTVPDPARLPAAHAAGPGRASGRLAALRPGGAAQVADGRPVGRRQRRGRVHLMQDFVQRLFQATPRTYVTTTVVAANVIVWLLTVLLGVHWLAPSPQALLLLGGNFLPLTLEQPWRLLSSTVLHAGVIHLAFNMWAMLNMGRIAERFYGNTQFAI